MPRWVLLSVGTRALPSAAGPRSEGPQRGGWAAQRQSCSGRDRMDIAGLEFAEEQASWRGGAPGEAGLGKGRSCGGRGPRGRSLGGRGP